MTRPSPPGLAPRSIAGSLVRVSSLTASVQVEQPFALPRSAGCDSSECSVCHWEQTACAKRHRFLDTTTSAVGAATASRRSSLQSSYTLGDLASSSSLRRQMTQHDTDSCTSQAGAAAEACSRHAKRQRLDTGQSQLRTVCGSDADAAAKGELDARDFAFPPASRSCTPPEEDAMVPSASRLARAEGSHSQLAALDCCWVPSEAALLGRRDSSSLAAAGGDDMSAHVLPQIAVTPLAEATVPQTRQQQQQQQQQRAGGSDATYLDGLDSSSRAGDSQGDTSRQQQQPMLTEVNLRCNCLHSISPLCPGLTLSVALCCPYTLC